MKIQLTFTVSVLVLLSLACSLSTPPSVEQAGALQPVSTPDQVRTVKPAQSTPHQPLPLPTPTPKSCIVTAEVLHLRTCADLECAVIDWLMRGERLTLLATSGDWLQVQTQAGQTGWVHSKYCGGQP